MRGRPVRCGLAVDSIRNRLENAAQVRSNGRDSRKDHNGDQSGEKAVLDGARAVFRRELPPKAGAHWVSKNQAHY